MVGVCFWFFNLVFVMSLCLAKPKDCPEVCNCLGTYVDCSRNKLDSIPTNIPKWATHLLVKKGTLYLFRGNWIVFAEIYRTTP